MIEVLKQMTEALEDFVDVIKYDNEQDDIGRRACCDVLSYNPHSESCKAKQAITAIKEAIRERALYEVQRLGQEIEQEPVGALTLGGIIDTSDGLEYEGWDVEWDTKAIEVLQEKLVTSDSVEVMLYTHPPQRTWARLTDEDCRGMSAGDRLVAMWADRTLKEKNT